MKDKVVLAYSGGLDTSVILKWLEVEKNYDVIAVCIDLGQNDNFDFIKEKALKTGASKVYVIDAKEEFVKDYVFKGIKASAKYEDDYLLGTPYSRPLIAQKLVEVAEKENATAIAHGATGKGNDQVRFEAGIKYLNPHIKIIAPWRTWDLKSREDCIKYADKYGIDISSRGKKLYSRDENLFHVSTEGLILEDTWNEHLAEDYMMTTPIEDTPDNPDIIEISFEKGEAISIDGKEYQPIDILKKLNDLGGKHGIGVVDIVENRLLGMKSRGVYETPAGTILHKAHKAIEKLVLDKESYSFKNIISQKYGELLYDAKWFSQLRPALDAFINEIQKNVSGTVKVKLFKGNCQVIASKSDYSLYKQDYVTFEEDDVYNQYDAEGFINLYTLPLKMHALTREEGKK